MEGQQKGGQVMNLLECRWEASLLGSLLAGSAFQFFSPFPRDGWLFELLLSDRPWVFYGVSGIYSLLCYSTPFFLISATLSLAYILMPGGTRRRSQIALPPPPEPTELAVVVGEIHQERLPEPSDSPRWLVIPERGLFTGIAIIGAIGSGKTSCCMYPFAKRIFSYGDSGRRVGGLVLEVKWGIRTMPNAIPGRARTRFRDSFEHDSGLMVNAVPA